jgi:hypothetical protein
MEDGEFSAENAGLRAAALVPEGMSFEAPQIAVSLLREVALQRAARHAKLAILDGAARQIRRGVIAAGRVAKQALQAAGREIAIEVRSAGPRVRRILA